MTAQTWIDRTRDLLLAGTVENLNRLNGSIDDNMSSSSLTLEFNAGPIVVGSVIELGTELMYVTSVSAQQVGVMRAYGGSSISSHAYSTIVRSNPQYPSHQILNCLIDDLNDLSAKGLYQIKTNDFTYTSGTDGYDLASDCQAVQRVTYTDTSGDLSEPEIRRYDIRRNRNSSTFSSTVALVLFDGATSGQIVRVEYRAPYASLTNSSSALSGTGLHAEAYDLPPLGAALALMTMKPIPRESITTQAPMRRSEEVPSGAISASLRDLRFRRQEIITAEVARLAQMYPTTWVRSGR